VKQGVATLARVLVMVGTKKGAFLLESDEARKDWRMRGPFCEGWPINHVNYDPATRSVHAATASAWYGPAVWRSRDLGETWTHSSQGITYGENGPAIEKLWNVTPAHGALYVGVDPAGLFRSDDGGETFVQVEGLRQHPTCSQWQPGNGGLCLHTIVPHPTDPQQMWVAASAVGCFYTADGGKTWETRNRGIRADYMPAEADHEIGYCVHKIAMAPGDPDRLWQQSHQGVYRSDDAGRTWQWINGGLPSTFGFPIVAHPRDPNTAYVVPLSADANRYVPDGAAAVWRTRDGGATWDRLSHGLPQSGAYLTVLREAMATDPLDEAGIYFGTSTGQLFVSADGGDTWSLAADFLPSIYSVEVAVMDSL
jgi:photosystem II stability/assembly factor-like uncharacterized protein